MRKVECTIVKSSWVDGSRVKSEEIINGVFHQWGSAYEEFDTGPGNYTVAIIELDDGSIKEFLPQHVRFTSAA